MQRIAAARAHSLVVPRSPRRPRDLLFSRQHL